MDHLWIDNVAVHLASGRSRRKFLGTALAAAGLVTVGRDRAAAFGTPQCEVDIDCGTGMMCAVGVCVFLPCTDYGLACVSHNDCCDPYICTGGVCSTTPQCGLEGAGCANDAACCPGLVCPAGTCILYTPPPPPPDPPPTEGGGGDGSGNGASAPPPDSSGQSPSGIVISSLPNTGRDSASDSGVQSGIMLAAGALGLGAVAGRFRRWRVND